MRRIDEFDVSDLAASTLQGWRVRWGAEGTGMVLLVDMSTPKENSSWILMAVPENAGSHVGWVSYDEETGRFFETKPEGESGSLSILKKTLTPDMLESVPKILKQCYEDHYSKIPAPRYENRAPLLDKTEAKELENEFFKKCIEPYLSTHQVYTIDQSGTILANRLEVIGQRIVVRHYDDDTFQNDSGIRIDSFVLPEDPEEPILIIDDMVSSGRTAEAVIKKFENLGFTRIRYTALFNIAASREVFEYESYLDLYKTVSNFYWMYGRGMDLFSDSSRSKQLIRGADKRFGWEKGSDINDLRNFFSQQS